LAFRDFSSLTTHFQPPVVGVEYTYLWRMSSPILAFRILFFSRVIGYEERGVKTANGKIQKEQEQSEAQSDGA
jgi:hypothetical protein